MTGVLAGLLLVVAAPLGAAGLGMPFELGAEKEDLVVLSVTWDAPSYSPGDDVHGSLEAVILEGWHINSVEPLDDFAIATTLEISSPALAAVAFEFPLTRSGPSISREEAYWPYTKVWSIFRSRRAAWRRMTIVSHSDSTIRPATTRSAFRHAT